VEKICLRLIKQWPAIRVRLERVGRIRHLELLAEICSGVGFLIALLIFNGLLGPNTIPAAIGLYLLGRGMAFLVYLGTRPRQYPCEEPKTRLMRTRGPSTRVHTTPGIPITPVEISEEMVDEAFRNMDRRAK